MTLQGPVPWSDRYHCQSSFVTWLMNSIVTDSVFSKSSLVHSLGTHYWACLLSNDRDFVWHSCSFWHDCSLAFTLYDAEADKLLIISGMVRELKLFNLEIWKQRRQVGASWVYCIRSASDPPFYSELELETHIVRPRHLVAKTLPNFRNKSRL